MKPVFASLLVSAAVVAISFCAYEKFVRQPRTPRLAVVDITRIYEEAEASARRVVLSDAAAPRGESTASADRNREIEVARRNAENFGPALHKVLTDISTECGCAIVAMAAVVGTDSSIPDFTTEAATRMNIDLTHRITP